MHALITDMDQPLGYAIGNALEVKEAIRNFERQRSGRDFTELVLSTRKPDVDRRQKAEDVASAEKMLRQSIQNGDALRKLEAFVKAQGGTGEEFLIRRNCLVSPCRLQYHRRRAAIFHIQCDEIGVCSCFLEAEERQKTV